MSAFDQCMAKLDEIDQRLDAISGDQTASGLTPEFVWLWMFCIPAGSILGSMLVIAFV